jgi:putative FmdB family regulatory protein
LPTYEYACPSCKAGFDIIKSVKAIDQVETCPKCSSSCDSSARQISRTNFTGASDWNTQTFHPALGQVVRNNKHAAQIAKSRGMIEVGNEKVETVHAHFEKQREETREQRWKDADKVKVYD